MPLSLDQAVERIEARLERIEQRLDLVTGSPPAYGYKLDEAAKMLGMGRTKLAALISDKKVRPYRLGGRSYIGVAELIRLTTTPEQAPRTPARGPRPAAMKSAQEMAVNIRRAIREDNARYRREEKRRRLCLEPD